MHHVYSGLMGVYLSETNKDNQTLHYKEIQLSKIHYI